MLLLSLLLLCLPVAKTDASEDNNFPTATTNLGKIKGHHKYSYGKKIFSAFEGIPYAQPPVADLRFKEPQEAKPWPGLLETITVHKCMQKTEGHVLGEEDCLYLNVYVPRANPLPNESLDVVVHIHGGAFLGGNPLIAGPDYLMDRNLIYINLSYRLSMLGFLSTEDEVVPGNNGLKDQAMALKWIKSNVHCFGGNPNSVTIIGASAGGASVHFHYFSPLSRGLFKGGISQSGTALAPWALQLQPLRNAIRLGNAVGCPHTSTEDLVNCLKSRPVLNLFESVYSVHHVDKFPLAPFSPVIENNSKTAFLTDYPYTLLKKGKVYDVPWISTINTDEGLLYYHLCSTLENTVKHWNEDLPYVLEYFNLATESDQLVISKKIKEFYFSNNKVTKEKFVKAYGDRLFTIPMEMSVRMHARVLKSSVFSYVYGYSNSFTTKVRTDMPSGVNHCEDSQLLYKYDSILKQPEKLTSSDERVKNVLIDMVTTFAKNGVPKYENIEWAPVSGGENYEFLFIENSDNIRMKHVKELAPIEFWNSLPIKEYDKFNSTCCNNINNSVSGAFSLKMVEPLVLYSIIFLSFSY